MNLKILYLETAPPPAIAGTDAVFQEIAALQSSIGGDRLNLFPLKSPSRFVPKFLYGIHSLNRIDEINRDYDAFHIYNSELKIFPFLRKLQKPIIYSVVAGLGSQAHPPTKQDMQHIHTVVISNERDQDILESWDIKNYRLIRSGIDTARFEKTPAPLLSDLTLLVGSAPWTKGQFVTKGINALIEAAAKINNLKLVFLWRGGHLQLLRDKIAKARVQNSVEIINEKTNVAKLMQRVHATVVLAASSKLVKAYPHSLLESLAAGRPVLISRSIPMSDYVEQKHCGIVVEKNDISNILAAIKTLQADYAEISLQATAGASSTFSQQRLINEYRNLYAQIY
jgi:glycosyltransferase involved in cell wall biosynthesis